MRASTAHIFTMCIMHPLELQHQLVVWKEGPPDTCNTIKRLGRPSAGCAATIASI